MEAPKKNDPTAIETALAYMFWAAVFAAVYFVGLKPRGLTVQKAVAWAKGAKPASKSKASKNDKGAKPKPMTPEKVMAPPPKPKPEKKRARPPMRVIRKRPMALSQDDD